MFEFVSGSSVPITLASATVTAAVVIEAFGLVITIVTCSISGNNWLLNIALLPLITLAAATAFALPPFPGELLTFGVMVIGLPYPVALSTGAPKT
jgi:hypothetical protein